MGLATDTEASTSAKTAVVIVVTLAVFGLLAAVTLPVAISEIAGNQSATLTQDVSTEYEVNAALNSTVTSVTASTTDTATVELNDTRTSGTTSKTINNGSTADYSLQGGTVTVGLESVDTSPTPSTATVNYTYSNDYAYSGAASSLWGVLGLVIVLAAILYAVGVAMANVDL